MDRGGVAAGDCQTQMCESRDGGQSMTNARVRRHTCVRLSASVCWRECVKVRMCVCFGVRVGLHIGLKRQ